LGKRLNKRAQKGRGEKEKERREDLRRALADVEKRSALFTTSAYVYIIDLNFISLINRLICGNGAAMRSAGSRGQGAEGGEMGAHCRASVGRLSGQHRFDTKREQENLVKTVDRRDKCFLSETGSEMSQLRQREENL
jgi:hypothetical protein